jgi:flagellar motility protein MotE (MotC chaperone)
MPTGSRTVPKFRLLMLTAVVATVALSLRCGDLVRVIQPAAAKDAGAPVSKPKEPTALRPEARKEAEPARPEEKREVAKAESKAGNADPTPLIEVPFTRTELDLLQKLSVRRDALDMRERELDMREGLLKAAEQTLQARTAELIALRAKIEAATTNFQKGEDEKLDSLVKIYEAMRPKEAARIFDELEMSVLVDVLKRMKEMKSSQILASMDPARVRTITTRLAERQTLPGSAPTGG